MDLEWAQGGVGAAESAVVRGRKSLVLWRRIPTILLLENDKKTRRMLAGALRRESYRVIEIANGDDALDWLGPGVVDGDLERIPDLVVSNVHLPYFDGLEILEQLQVCTRRIPVILITTRPDSDTHSQAVSLGAQCVLERPFDLGDLRAAVHKALKASRSAPSRARDASS
jgi:DNA-binding response OmpR family regulator